VGTQRRQGRQRQDKVADGSSANDQDPAFAFAHFEYFAFLRSIPFAGRSATRPAHTHATQRNTVNPRTATKAPNARRNPLNIRMRCSLAVAQVIQSRNRQGEMVSHIPSATHK